MKTLTVIVIGVVLALSASFVAAPGNSAAKIFTAGELEWRDGPPTLPAGAQMVVLDGDPQKEGLFTIRLKMPAGYRIPPHTHPTAERVTVIAGTVYLGFGKEFDESAGVEMKAGDFTVVAPGVAHFAWSSGEAILQIDGEGPFRRSFIEPAPDAAATKK